MMDLYAEAERIVELDEDGDETVWVVLAAETLGGKTWGLVVEEADLAGPEDQMGVGVVLLGRGPDGETVIEIPDEDAPATALAWAHFTSLMGLEAS